jgi:hypothetical protein
MALQAASPMASASATIIRGMREPNNFMGRKVHE